jgi:hypothetical protein
MPLDTTTVSLRMNHSRAMSVSTAAIHLASASSRWNPKPAHVERS